MIDKTDEYQMIFFITRFKSLGFFLSYGLIKLIIQYIQYYQCVVFGTDDAAACGKSGPGQGLYVYPEAAALAFQMIMLWTGFFCL